MSEAENPAPDGYPTVAPYLIVDDAARLAEAVGDDGRWAVADQGRNP
jgi:hypothetical protein